MNTEALGKTHLGMICIRIMVAIMESRFRYRFFGSTKILEGADLRPGTKVLEIGCGTGFFTITAGRMLGSQGNLIAMDMSPLSVEAVSKKVKVENLQNVTVTQGDALNTQLETESVDKILMFGVIPAPMLPMDKLMAEMHRILKPGGIMAVWPPSWVHRSILQSGNFTYFKKQNNVLNYKRAER